jgi:hypothetical protein
MVPASGRALTLHEFQNAFQPLVGAIVIAIVLSFIIRETGLAAAAHDPRDSRAESR